MYGKFSKSEWSLLIMLSWNIFQQSNKLMSKMLKWLWCVYKLQFMYLMLNRLLPKWILVLTDIMSIKSIPCWQFMLKLYSWLFLMYLLKLCLKLYHFTLLIFIVLEVSVHLLFAKWHLSVMCIRMVQQLWSLYQVLWQLYEL